MRFELSNARTTVPSERPPQIAVRTRLDDGFGSSFRSRSPDEIQALVAAEVEGEITNQRLQEMLALHRVDITRMLRGLVHDTLLVSEGHGRGTRYFPIVAAARSGGDQGRSLPAGGFVLPGSPNMARAVADLSSSSPDLSSSSPDLSSSSPDLSSSSPDLAGSSPDLSGSSPDLNGKSSSLLPAARQQESYLQELARPVSEVGKAPADVVRQVILELCDGRFLTLGELSSLLKRNKDALRGQYITNMIDDGRLELRYPESRNHPRQAYHTRPDGAEASV